ncbi:hypothetical protein BBK36DRAFT_1143624 [Trichoderma citrinoviride]|uniref:Uncharacterized protein n=1 Tax=Trichoderma citrinoviride TaxID=58853 RepID=A0A2T4B3N8_9HYPO|nr:hypothetical protein BBK36DRAFT_1143624 [Trichoderma citrinoviride]PTB63920.1 hypothetical protein BBK36DRAFT_1143624 [Trichoderma citrinoviride]
MFYETLYVHDAKAAACQPTLPYRAAAAPAKAASSCSNNNNNMILQVPKPQAQRPKPLDADDLTRRLHVVLAEQKAHAERKKRARAALDAERQANAAAVARNASALHPGQRGIAMGPTVPSTQIQKKEATASKSHVRGAPRDSHQDVPKTDRLHKAGMKNSTSSSSNRNSEDAPPANYRHIPQVAALQFARTTTTETVTEKHLVHKLSRQAIKHHVQGPNAAAGRAPDVAPAEQHKALRRAQSMRERQYYEQNQFQLQHPHILATTTEVDERPATTAPHTFHEYLQSQRVDALDESSKEMRRRSMGAILSMMVPRDAETAELSHTSSENQSAPSHSDILPANPDEHRVDWTQSDEAAILQQKQQQQQQQESHPQLPQQSQKSTSGPNVLRKAESKWALRTRLGSFSKKGDKLPSPTEEKDVGSPERPKSPTKAGGLFSRFKR